MIIKKYLFSFIVLIMAVYFGVSFGATSGLDFDSIVQLRLPRVLLAISSGMSLACAGAVLQALFTNPLCDPYTLGVSSGAALGAALGIVLGFEAWFLGLALSAFIGALAFMLVLILISQKTRLTNLTLLLCGVMLGFLGSSGVAICMTIGDAQGMQNALFWLMGDLSRARMHGVLLTLFVSLILIFMLWRKSTQLDAFLMGEENASGLGVSVPKLRRQFIFLTSLLVGLSVASSGMIGFLGLIVPHFSRKLVGSLHFNMIPFCIIWGAVALVLADLMARVLLKPYELPVGVITAFVGAPLFIWMILSDGRSRN